MALPVGREQPAGGIERGEVPQAGKCVEDCPFHRGGVTDAVCRQQRKALGQGEIDQKLIFKFFFRQELALQFDVQPLPSENPPQIRQGLAARRGAAFAPGSAHRPLFVPGERDQAATALRKFGPGHPALALGGAEVSGSEEAAKIAIALAARDQQRNDASILHRHLRPDEGREGRTFFPT